MSDQAAPDETPDSADRKDPSRRHSPGPGSSSVWAGIAIALMMAMRSIFPLIRSLGPGGTHALVLVATGAAPALIGMEMWRRRVERREERLRAERARARLARSGSEADPVDHE